MPGYEKLVTFKHFQVFQCFMLILKHQLGSEAHYNNSCNFKPTMSCGYETFT